VAIKVSAFTTANKEPPNYTSSLEKKQNSIKYSHANTQLTHALPPLPVPPIILSFSISNYVRPLGSRCTTTGA